MVGTLADELFPWDFHGALRADRLVVVATYYWKAAAEAAIRLDKKKGETAWSAGIVRYERFKHATGEAVKANSYPWLSLDEEDGRLVLLIGGVPVRVYRSIPDLPAPERYSQPNRSELRSLQTAFLEPEGSRAPKGLFRMELETNSDVFPTQIQLVQVDRYGARYHPYIIPVNARTIERRLTKDRSAKTMPPPVVGSLDDVSIKDGTNNTPRPEGGI